MSLPIATIPPIVGRMAILSITAAAIVVWRPAWAEFASHRILNPGIIGTIALLALCVWWFMPAHYLSRSIAALCYASFFFALLIAGLLFVPAEMRGGKEIRPLPDSPAQKPIADQLREPWSSVAEAFPPASLVMAKCALLAYDAPGQWRKSVPELGFEDHIPVVQGCAKAIVMTIGTEAVIAFQGTDDAGDWLVNLDKDLAAPPDDPVHRGFLKAYRSVEKQVHDALTDNGIRHVWITGHSLGGAMSVLCAIQLIREEAIDVRGVITFGQPLLLSPSFAVGTNELLAGRHMRFIYEDDLVTRIVPGFRGGGSSIWFKEGKPEFIGPRMYSAAAPGSEGQVTELEVEDGPPPLTDEEFEAEKARIRTERNEASEQRAGESLVAQGLPTAKDHPMELYLDAVQAHVGQAMTRMPAAETSEDHR